MRTKGDFISEVKWVELEYTVLDIIYQVFRVSDYRVRPKATGYMVL